MKIKVYTIYFNNERQESYLFRKKARKYVKLYQDYFNDKDIYYLKEVIYVWYSDTNDGSISWFNTRYYRYIFNIWFNGKFIIWEEVVYG